MLARVHVEDRALQPGGLELAQPRLVQGHGVGDQEGLHPATGDQRDDGEQVGVGQGLVGAVAMLLDAVLALDVTVPRNLEPGGGVVGHGPRHAVQRAGAYARRRRDGGLHEVTSC